MIIHGKGDEEYCVDIVKDKSIMYKKEWDEWCSDNATILYMYGYISQDIFIGIQEKNFKGIVDNPSILR